MEWSWSNELVLQFLDLYENEPILWNPSHYQHKNREEIYDAWKRIRENMNVDFSVYELKKKKDSLMAAYRTIVNKQKEKNKNGDEEYKPIWFAFEKMASFLKGRSQQKEAVISEENKKTDKGESKEGLSTVTDEEQSKKLFIIKNKRTFREDIEKSQKRVKMVPMTIKENNDALPSTQKPSRLLKQEENTSLQKPTRILNQEDDQYTVLGGFVASEIRSMKSEYLRKKTKRKILQVLMEMNEEEEDCLRNEVYPDPITILTVSGQSDQSTGNHLQVHHQDT
ncbi:UNVERIFIED_CONTAM: hypothetical protein RMT77_004709 [Armadillidium vulgare]